MKIDGEYLGHLGFAEDILMCANTSHELQRMLHKLAVESYIYLGQRITTRDKTQDKVIQIRITTGWTAFAKHRDIFKGNIGQCLQKQVYKSCVLRAMTYDAETWELTTQAKNKLAAAQTNMERSMLNITYGEREKHTSG